MNYQTKWIIVLLFTAQCCSVFGQKHYPGNVIRKDRERNIILPTTDNHYKAVQYYVETELDSGYIHAPEQSHEAFRDIKFAVRIHWGIYSIWEMDGESWGYLKLSPEKKMEYNELYKTFNPTGFDAQEWMDLFKRSGIKAFAFTTKHHEGFSLFHTRTRVKNRVNYRDTTHPIESCDLAYSIEETPFKRDIVKELCDAAHQNDIRIDLYFSHPDWYDADFRPYSGHPLLVPDFLLDSYKNYGNHSGFSGALSYGDIEQYMTPNRTPEETARMIARHREQLHELLTNYGKIDMLCLDMWLGRDVWPEMKQTIHLIRQWQPELMIRCRGIGSYGDYYTPENFVPQSKENTNMPWMTIYPLGKSFSFDKNGGNYKGAPWIIHNIIDCAAKGGSFMVGIGPDGNGQFHPKAIEQLEETGRWLKVNGEGIYATRERDVWKDGDLYFTQSKDHRQVFVFTEKWPGRELIVKSVAPAQGSPLFLLGYPTPLKWTALEEGIKIEIPEALQLPEKRPCEHAWAFRIIQTP
ncbi:MAG: alpha-L-fucosidase [Dysgonamonadaceae bacterium]|jgi:alpha-L-fucosidase|nr:alpha-L-fucosidase [Dysgonamonadaceae bacterium]